MEDGLYMAVPGYVFVLLRLPLLGRLVALCLYAANHGGRMEHSFQCECPSRLSY